jgi:modification methylase
VIVSTSNPGELVLDPFCGSGTTAAVAKKLGRRWIAIEQDEEYIQIAQARLDAVTPLPLDSLTFGGSRRGPRIPFGALLEHGLIQPGQTLTFGKRGVSEAVVLGNGHLRCNGQEGSIHAIGRLITGSPCNGWEHWYVMNSETGQRQVIDELRKQILAMSELDN